MGTTSGNNYTTLYSTTAGQVQPGRTTGSNLAVQDQGSTITSTANTLNFTGNGVVASAVGNVVTIDIPGSSGTALIVQDEGNVITSTANTLNFTGNGITASAVGNVVTVNVTTPTITSNIIYNGNSNVSIPAADGNIYINANAGTDFQTVFDTSGNITVPGQILGSKFANASSPLGANIVLTANTIVSKVKSGTVFTEVNQALDNWYVYVNGDQPGANASFSTIELRTFDENAPTANISVQSAATGVTKLWTFDSTGTLTTPANSVISSVTNDLTLQANTLYNNLRINGVADTGALPGSQQTGWLFNNNWQRSGATYDTTTYASPFINTGSFTSNATFYLYSFTNTSGTTIGSPTITVDTATLSAGGSTGGVPLTWDSANTTPMIGQGIAVYDTAVSLLLPSSTVFPAGTTIQSIDVGAGTITMSANALKTATASNVSIQSGTMISSPAYEFYMLIGDNANSPAGKIQGYTPPIIPASKTSTFGVTGWGGPFLNDTPAGNTFTYSPAQTWITYPELRDGTSPGGYRAIDVNNVPGTIMSFSRYNNPIMIGAGSDGNAAGYPTSTGRSDSTTYNNGITLLKSGLDTRRNAETGAANPSGTLPPTALNLISYDLASTTGNANTQRQTREKTGPVFSTFVGNGNINTDNANIYAKAFQGGGSIRFNLWHSQNGASDTNPNFASPMAGIYSRAEQDFNGLFTVTGASGTGTTATVTFATQTVAPYYVGQNIVVSGMTPAGYNAPFPTVVTAVTTNSVSYASTETGAFVSGGTVQSGFTQVPTGLYLQYTPTNVAVGSPRTFLRATGQDTTVSGGANVYLKPLANMTSITSNNFRRELNSQQDTIWLQASSYTGGNSISEGTGTLLQARGTRSTGNVAIGINRTVGTTASYELILKTGESQLTLYDKNNTKNIATFTNTLTTLNTPLNITGSTSGNVSFTAGTTPAAQAYTLPQAYPTVNGQVLVSTTAGTMSWATSGTTGATYLDANWTTATGTVTANVIYGFPLTALNSSSITIATGNIAINDTTATGPTRITLGTGGNFNLQFSIQLANNHNAEEDVDVWLRKNGTDVADTNTQISVVKTNGSTPGKNIMALNLLLLNNNAGDYYELVWATTNADCKPEVIAAISSPFVRPRTPSIIATVTPVGA